jgi:predicted transcriptional regulator
MRPKKTMKKKPTGNAPHSDVNEAAAPAWNNGCPFLPVVAPDGKVVGVITDRDICSTVAVKHRHFELTTVGTVTPGRSFPCMSDEEVRAALKTLLGRREVHVEGVGGILRHDTW